MPVPMMCQRESFDGQHCGNTSKGYVLTDSDSALAVWKEGKAYCKPCGEAIRDAVVGSMYYTVAELRDRMEEEDREPHNDTADDTADDGQADLAALAQHFNQANVDSIPQSTLEPQSTAAVPQAAPCAPPATPKAKRILDLRADIAKQQDAIVQLRTLADSNPGLAEHLQKSIKDVEIKIKSWEKDIAKLLEPDVRVVHPKGKAWLDLRAAIYLGGDAALAAVDAAIESGILKSKGSAAKKAAETGSASGDTPAPASATPDEREALRLEIRKRIALGFRDGQIAKELGIPDSTVYTIRNPKKKAA